MEYPRGARELSEFVGASDGLMLFRQAAGVVLLVLVATATAAGDKDKDIKPLDLGSVRAHEKQVDVSIERQDAVTVTRSLCWSI